MENQISIKGVCGREAKVRIIITQAGLDGQEKYAEVIGIIESISKKTTEKSTKTIIVIINENE